MSTAKEIPKLVTFDLEARDLFIDGELFPWYFTDGWTVTSDGVLAYVTLTLLADAFSVTPGSGSRSARTDAPG